MKLKITSSLFVAAVLALSGTVLAQSGAATSPAPAAATGGSSPSGANQPMPLPGHGSRPIDATTPRTGTTGTGNSNGVTSQIVPAAPDSTGTANRPSAGGNGVVTTPSAGTVSPGSAGVTNSGGGTTAPLHSGAQTGTTTPNSGTTGTGNASGSGATSGGSAGGTSR